MKKDKKIGQMTESELTKFLLKVIFWIIVLVFLFPLVRSYYIKWKMYWTILLDYNHASDMFIKEALKNHLEWHQNQK